MTSKFIIQKTCIYCENHFTARTMYTKYCSHLCNQRHYKQRKREEKRMLEKAGVDTRPLPSLQLYKNRTYMSVKECSEVIGVSTDTIRSWIKARLLKASKIQNNILILKDSIETLIKKNQL